jgi:membrane-associated protease RseP (regulator of RpoE activity)
MLNRRICAAAATAVMLLTLMAGAQAPEVRRGIDLGLINDVSPNASDSLPQRGEYWLGVVVSPPSAELQKQLKLPKDQGLLVERVEPNSPAAAAGVEPNDVLLKANDKPVADIRDFLKLINEVKEGKLTLQMLRNGKEQTVVATLAKRPAWARQPLDPQAQAWIEMLNPRNGFLIVGPGQIVPPDARAADANSGPKVDVTVHLKAALADGSQVEITREDGKPAKVVVTREKDRWEATSDDLSKLPEKTRPEVERLLRSSTDRIHLLAAPGPAPAGVVYLGGMPGTMAAEPSVEKRLNEMQKQIDELKQQVKDLQDKANAAKK